MLPQAIDIDGKTYWLKIGLKGLMYLQSILQYDEEDMFTAFIISLQSITIEQAKALYKRVPNCSIVFQPLFEQVVSFLTRDAKDLYSTAVGELGISPDIAFQMSPDEIDLAYMGYLRRKEMDANLTKLAVLQALEGNNKPIKLIDNLEYAQGSIEERNRTFAEWEIE